MENIITTIKNKIAEKGFNQTIYYCFLTLINPLKRSLIQIILGAGGRTYSQKYEDIIIDTLLSKSNGFYIDIGANDPIIHSNTKRFYDNGWSGINIEPNISKFMKIAKDRTRDINLNIGISRTTGKLNFYVFNPDTLSTFDREVMEQNLRNGFKIIDQRKVPTYQLSSILDKYVKATDIDFLSIDTEGMDLDILCTNNWKKYRPKLVCVEMVETNKNELYKQKLISFFKNNNYQKIYTSKHFGNDLNSIFAKKDYIYSIEKQYGKKYIQDKLSISKILND